MAERQDVEGVAGSQPIEGRQKRRAGLRDRGSLHGAGDVDHEQRLGRQAPPGPDVLERGQEHQQDIPAVLAVLGEQRRAGRGGEDRSPSQVEIAVGLHDPGARLDHQDVAVVPRGDRVGVAFDVLQGDAGVDPGDQPGARGLRGVCVRERRREPSAVGGPAGPVSRREGQRERQAEHPPVVGDFLQVLEIDLDRLTGIDVGGGGREQIGALVIDEGRLPPLLFRLLVDLLRLLALLDDRDDAALADPHLHPVHGGPLRKREDVDAFDDLGGRILERLGQRAVDQDAGHLETHAQGEHRQRDQPVRRLAQQLPAAGRAGPDGADPIVRAGVAVPGQDRSDQVPDQRQEHQDLQEGLHSFGADGTLRGRQIGGRHARFLLRSAAGGIASAVPVRSRLSVGGFVSDVPRRACRGRHTPCQDVIGPWSFRPGTG